MMLEFSATNWISTMRRSRTIYWQHNLLFQLPCA